METRTFTKLIIIFMFLLTVPISSVYADATVKVGIMNAQGGNPRPDLDTANVVLTFDGIQNGTSHILLTSPDRKFYSPTDFPFVEGTRLIDADLQVVNGKATFDYMFPIRGDYRMTVETKDENGQLVGSNDLTITIKENPEEVKNAIVLITILAFFGLMVGYIFAKLKRRANINAI